MGSMFGKTKTMLSSCDENKTDVFTLFKVILLRMKVGKAAVKMGDISL